MGDSDDGLDLFDDDGDGVVEMCTLFDEEENGNKSSNNGGCCIVLFALGSSLVYSLWSITDLIS